MNNNYYRWLYGDCGCGCNNGYKKIEDCSCEQILLDISNIHTDINVLQEEIDDIDLSNYYTKLEVDALIPTNVSELVNDAGYITNAALVDYATKQWVENKNYLTEHQHLKTINGQVISGDGNIVIEGSGTSVTVDEDLDPTSTNPVENKTIVGALNGKLDASAYTPTDLTNYYTKQEVNNLIPTSNSGLTNDAHYITSGDSVFNNYATTANTYTKTEVNNLLTNKIMCLTQAEYEALAVKVPDTLYLIYEV